MFTAVSSTNAFRLSHSVVPSRYDLVLEPDLEAFTFDGTAAITVAVREATSTLTINAIELAIPSVSFTQNGTTIDALSITFDEDAETVSVTFASQLSPGDAHLNFVFSGLLNDKLHGWYRSTYTRDDGETRVLAVTQFEATDARRAFPCWDEPEFKAVFGVTINVADGLMAVSNGAEKSTVPIDDGRRSYSFADSMKMSTYLVAFVVGELQATDAHMINGIPTRIVFPTGKGHLTDFALATARFALPWLANYFGTPYPSEKCDLVAVPDFAFGAMENQGCVTFRENLLLVDPAVVTKDELQSVADVINHELAHSWFGNLVTMQWWEGIWLNEAFATFMETSATHAYQPEWKVWEGFARSRSAAFDTDSLANSRPIEFPVNSPADCEGMFDVLTYEKGGSVLRMLEQYLGADVFRDGIRHYLKTHAYGNTLTTDLWDRIEESSGQPVRRIMDSWIYQMGYPIVDVKLDSAVLTLSQRMFRYAGGEEPPAQLWVIPVIVKLIDSAGAVTERRVLLDSETATIQLDDASATVVVNADAHGFFRVRYAGNLGDRLLANLNHLSTAERYALVDDAWAAVYADAMPAADFLAMADAFGGAAPELEVSVWQALALGLGELRRITPSEYRPALAARMAALTVPILNNLPADTEPELRAILFKLAGDLGHDADTIASARQLVATTQAVEPNLLGSATTVVAVNGTTADFDEFVARWKGAVTPQEENRYLYAMPLFPGEAELDRVLAMASNGEIRTQNAPFVLQLTLRHLDLSSRAWRHMRQHWNDLNEQFPTNLVGRMIAGLRVSSDESLLTDASSFVAEHPIPQAAKSVDQTIERMQVNVALRARSEQGLASELGQ